MGREAAARLTYGGTTGEGRALLESDELILRGAVKARLPRASLSNARVEGDDLTIDTPAGPLRLGLGAVEAGRWLTALAKPAPTLADKLGVKPGVTIWSRRVDADPALAAALAGATAASPDQAALGVAVVETADELEEVLARKGAGAAPLWLIYRKGAHAFGDAAIRRRMRELGFVDSKSCAVSPAFTATRYAQGLTPALAKRRDSR